MASNRSFLVGSLLIFLAATSTPMNASAQSRYRLASYPLQETGGFGQQDPNLQPGFGIPNQDNAAAQDEKQPMIINPAMLNENQGNDLPLIPELEKTRAPNQAIEVREKHAGWKQAGIGLGNDPVENPLRGNWVLIDATGKLSGTVFGPNGEGVSDVPLYLLDGGKVEMETRSENGGRFAFNNVQQGSYSLVGFGEDVFFAFGLLAIEHDNALASKMMTTLNVRTSENRSTINLDWIRHFSPGVKFRVLGRHESPETAEGPAELYGLEGISTLAPESAPATSVSGHAVALGAGGELVGRVHQFIIVSGRPVDVRTTRVMLLANNDVVTATDADNFGVFRFRGISPGQYALVAVGADGMGCIGISVVNESSSGILPEPVVPADPSVDATGADSAARQPAVAKRLAVDFSLMPPEATGWLNHMATEEAYRRALTRQRPKPNDLQPDMFAPICYSTPNGCFRQFFKQLNAASDMIFFGESSQYGYGNGYGGYGDYGYGYGNECGGCGGAGCQICQPGMMTDPNGMPYQVAPPVPDMMPIPQNGPVTIPGQMIYDQ